VVLDARSEKIREESVIRSRAVLWRSGSTGTGGAACWGWSWRPGRAPRAGRTFCSTCGSGGLTAWSSSSVTTTRGWRRAIVEVLPGSGGSSGATSHFLGANALDYLPRRGDDDCLQELRWIYNRRTIEEARRDLAGWLARCRPSTRSYATGSEANIEETLTLPGACPEPPQTHEVHQHAGAAERGDQAQDPGRADLPNAESCLRLIRALARGDSRETGSRTPLPSHERPTRAQEGGAPPPGPSGMTSTRLWKPRISLRSDHAVPTAPYDDWNLCLEFAELDRHNSLQRPRRVPAVSAAPLSFLGHDGAPRRPRGRPRRPAARARRPAPHSFPPHA